MAATDEGTLIELQLHTSHTQGHVSADWIKADGAWAAVTAGADGKLATWQPRQHKELKSVDTPGAAVTCLAVSPDGSMAATADAKNLIKTWHLPELLPTKAPIGRFTLPPRCCCWSRDGSQLAAGGDDGLVKLVAAKDGKTLRQLRCEGFVRGLALDPEGRYLAAANADGSLLIYDLAENGRQELKKVLAPKLDQDVPTARQGLAWHPDGGSLLAVAGRDGDVLLLERLGWRPAGVLSGGHSGAVGTIAFSPNGMYAATADTDGKLVVWLVENMTQVAARRLPSAASSLAWHPQNNALLVGAANGGVGVWVSPVPGDRPELPSPWQPVDDILREADERAAAAVASRSEAAGLEDEGMEDEHAADDDDDGDGGAAVIRRRGLKSRAAAAPADSAATGGADSLDEMLDQLDDAAEAAVAAAADHPSRLGRGAGGRGGLGGVPRPAVPPQAAVHPGSSRAGGAGGRFLSFNQLGCVVSKAVDDHAVIEVTFHDTGRHRTRVPNLTDYFGFTAASLGPRGVAYISPAAGQEQPSMLLYRGFEAWAAGSDWSVALPAGEEAIVVAAGSSAVAVATSSRLLRLYSLAGRQLAAISLAGPPIALVAADPGAVTSGAAAAAAAQHLLGVVWAEGPPEAGSGTQQLAYAVFDVSRSVQCCCGRLVLSRGAALTWLALSKEGLLAAMDSAGVLRVRSPEWGGCWLQMLDAAAAKAAAGADRLWPCWLDCNTLMAVVTTAKSPQPQVSPRPLVTPIALTVPSAPADLAPAGLEEAAIRAALGTAQLKALADGVEDAEEAAGLAGELEAGQREADRAALRLFNGHIKAGKQARALELVGCLHTLKSIEGAVKLANHHQLPALAERVQAFLEERLAWEQQQQEDAAAAAAAAAGGYQQQGWAGEDEAMQAQQEQQEAASAAHDVTVAAKPAPAAAVFGEAAKRAAAGAGAAAGGGSVKRKPLLDAGDTTNRSAPGSNPFARKKAAK